MNFEKLFSDFTQIKVAVIGDVMLDTYWWGHVERISPEAPVPVVSLDKKELRIGGAGNVALNLAALGATTSIISVIGNDPEGNDLKKLFEENKVNTQYLLSSSGRITTNKTRIISRNQQMMRLDNEIIHDISKEEEALLIEQFNLYIKENEPQIVVFEDYNKGLLTENSIYQLIAICKANHILTAVDPKKKNFLSFKGVDIFKPNLKEVKDGLNINVDEVDEVTLSKVHIALQQQLQHVISLITLSEHGIFYQSPETKNIIPTHVRNIADVSGAGDTVIAVASLVYAATSNIHLAAEISNIAGGLVCEEVGTAPIQRERLLKECQLLLK
jgi:rfaE bifunctional protein kinase chain/domain